MRWRALVRDRDAEAIRIAPTLDLKSVAFWDSQAPAVASRMSTAPTDPVVRRLRRSVGPRTAVLDVGAGTGRVALSLAARAREVTAVDPSPAMLAHLEREAWCRGLGNVRCVVGHWEDVQVRPAERELLLPDTHAVREELRRVLGSWLVRGRRGLHPPGIGRAVAMLRWRPAQPRCAPAPATTAPSRASGAARAWRQAAEVPR